MSAQAKPSPSGPAAGATVSSPASGTVLCRFDGAACEVVSLFERSLVEEARPRLGAFVQHYLPCASCRGAEAAAQALHGVRLGRAERRVLLGAATTTESKGALVAPTGLPRAERETALRAARKLYARQLIQISRTPLPLGDAGRNYLLRVAWRSPLGDAIVKQFGPELETGRRIRWDARLAAALRDARRGPVLLLGELASQLEAARARRAELVRLFAPVATRAETWKHVRSAEDARLLLVAVRAALEGIPASAEPAEKNG